MAKLGGTKGWLVLTGVAVLMALAVVPTFAAGAASASPAPLTAANSPTNQWAYGGIGWSNGSVTSESGTLTWNASFGWTVIFTETSTGADTVMVEEQRTVGIDLTAKYTGDNLQATYSFVGHEHDVAFANLTNDSTVYVNGMPVPALGIDNASTSINGSIAEAISVTHNGTTKSASLDVTGWAKASVQFTPALGLIPLNLTGVTEWNSTSYANPQGSWNITWTWADNGFGGAMGSGTRYSNGTVNTPGNVTLTGYDVTDTFHVPVFGDHVPRHAIVLIISGPCGTYDAFVFVPRAFDLFGGGAQPYSSNALGTASISSETLFVSQGSFGPQVTAASTSFGAGTASVNAVGAPASGNSPALGASPGSTVTGQPMSVAQAQAINNQLNGGPSSPGASMVSSSVAVAVVVGAVAVAAIILAALVVRNRSKQTPPHGAVGVPPAPAPAGPSVSGPTAPEAPK
jgi:hypothetical protein